MKNLITILFLAVCFFSCRKDPGNPSLAPVPSEKKYSLTFDMSDFGKEVQGNTKGNAVSDAPLKDFARFLVYIVYNAEGTEVNRLKQDQVNGTTTRVTFDSGEYFVDPQVFGCISDSLAAGDYTIVMLASKRNVSINNRSDEILDYSFDRFEDASFYYSRGLNSWSRGDDTFLKIFKVTIWDKDLRQKIVLDRIVGKAEINVLDSKPGTIFKFLFINENEALKFSDGLPFGSTLDIVNEENLQAVEGKDKLSYSKFVLNTSSDVDLIIKVYENGMLSTIKTVEDVRFYKNKRTILTGNIYSTKSESTAFNITVNDEFDEEAIEVTFD